MGKRIDVFIDGGYLGDDDYDMTFHYNDVEYFRVYLDQGALALARHFKSKLHTVRDFDGYTFTDEYGETSSKDRPGSVLGYITGLKKIDDSMIPLISACRNLDIQSDLVVHLNGEDFKLVGDVDGKDYVPDAPSSRKGFSSQALKALDERLSAIKTDGFGGNAK